jgi:PAS domain S-box-containing protein
LSGTLIYISISIFLNRKVGILLREIRKPIPNFEYLQKNSGDKISELLIEIKNSLRRTKESTDFGKYLTAISNSTNDAIIITDVNVTIESWNRSAEKIFGYPADFVVGKSILLLVMPERKDVAISIIKDRILKGEGVFNYNAKLKTAKEEVVDVSISATAIKDESGNFIAITNVIKDSTKEKECELVLQSKIDELEKINQLMVGRELKINELKKKLEKYEQ